MAELVKKLYIKKDGNAVAHKIYSTAAEAGAANSTTYTGKPGESSFVLIAFGGDI